jgi:ribosomal protein L37AE/L43A
MTKLRENETFSSHGPECPKCGFTFTPDDSIYYDENRYTEDECPECETKFRVEVYTSTSWTCTIESGSS